MSKTKKILTAFFTILLVFSLVSIARTYLQDYAEQQQIKELAEIREKEAETGEGAATPSPFISKAYERVMLPEFQELYKRNPDIVGWLKIDGSRIDYPIMQNQQDAQYYLNHGFDKKENKNGLPFLDEHSRINGSDILLIHGHHMKSGVLFADLMKYKKESYYKEHATFQFSSLYEKEEYEIVAVILSKVYRQTDDVFKYYQIEKVGTSDEFDSYIQNIKKLALYDTGVTARYGDKLIILSTCEYSTEDGRLAVVARKRT
ncbi:class B sortase [Paenibacillus dendritiformis]|uniref:Peptidase C60 sortase A and B n=1 Tax=Paenibacillus dendritiformis C454 TaxID=1131935 RepID=H3SMP4_9BACL|nr:class B sortase [Paenibacillus dendritiformis]EHQ59650.1 peptidase C60 sortase A and B [Paenibacillus dendritiformis C454]CAH8768721.1 class B sortase [Paenibacillus dendritiformis]